MARFVLLALAFWAASVSVFAEEPAHFASYERLHNFLSVPPTQGGLVSVSRTFFDNDDKLDKYLDVNYDINLAMSWLVFQWSQAGASFHPSPASVFSSVNTTADQGPVVHKFLLGATGYYNSSYDFRLLSLYSDPVVSKLQNPGIEVFFEQLRLPEYGPQNDVMRPGAIVVHAALGMAHESNGQFLERVEDFQKIKAIDESLYDQSFASMGWNYWFVKSAFDLPWVAQGHQILATAEGRFFLPTMGIEDATDITNTGIRAGGIWAYDGIRLGLVYQGLARTLGFGGLSVKTQVILPSLVDRWGQWQYRSGDIPVGLDTIATAEVGTVPVFVGLALGTGQTPSWYFKNAVTLKVGVSFPTMFYLNDLEGRD